MCMICHQFVTGLCLDYDLSDNPIHASIMIILIDITVMSDRHDTCLDRDNTNRYTSNCNVWPTLFFISVLSQSQWSRARMKVGLWTLTTWKILWSSYLDNGCHGKKKKILIAHMLHLWSSQICTWGFVTESIGKNSTQFPFNPSDSNPASLTRAPWEGQGPSIVWIQSWN